jgi:hypothetical protein
MSTDAVPSRHTYSSAGAPEQQPQHRAHGTEIRRQIEHVRGREQQDERHRKPLGAVPPQIAGNPQAAYPRDAGADLLHCHQQREAEGQRPGECVTELRADLRVSADTARVVVAGAGDETRTQTQRGAVLVAHLPAHTIVSRPGVG